MQVSWKLVSKQNSIWLLYKQLLEMCPDFEDSSNFLDYILSLDKAWVYYYDPENKKQSKQ